MEETEPIGRIVRPCGGGAAAGGKLCLELEGVLFRASEMLARGRGGATAPGTAVPLVVLDFRDATEPAGETTDGREVAFASAGGGLEDASEASRVGVRDLGARGTPVAEDALDGNRDGLLLGGAGPEADVLDEAMVEVLTEFTGGAVDNFFAEDGVAVVLDRGEEGEAVAALPGGAGLALPVPNVACPAHGQHEAGVAVSATNAPSCPNLLCRKWTWQAR